MSSPVPFTAECALPFVAAEGTADLGFPTPEQTHRARASRTHQHQDGTAIGEEWAQSYSECHKRRTDASSDSQKSLGRNVRLARHIGRELRSLVGDVSNL